MSSIEIVAIVVVVLLFLAIIALVAMQQRKRNQLKERFGPEYERTVEHSDRRTAERELKERAERRDQLDIRPLPQGERDAFAARWRETQEEFVDRPTLAVRQADLLVAEVMGRRGYPVGDFDEQADLVSVDHAEVVEQYRAAHEISGRNERNEATTEELRQAMVHYRALFSDLLAETDGRSDYPEGGYADEQPLRPTDRSLRS